MAGYMLKCFLILFFSVFAIARLQTKRKEDSLDDRVKQLTDLSHKKSVLRLNSDKFRLYVKAALRNYSVIVMLTALQPQRNCHHCKLAAEEYQVVANSWRYSPQYSSELFFAMVDFDDSQDVFESFYIKTAPVFMHFPARRRLKKSDTMDITRVGFSAEEISKWVAERTDIQIRVLRPPNYFGSLAVALLFTLVAGLLYLTRNNLEYLYNKTCWGVFALAIIFTMTSGQMWNHIRGPMFRHKNPSTGEIHYINGSSQGQFILESYLVMLLHCAVVVGFILLNEASTVKLDVGKRRIMVIVGLASVAVFFSLLLSVFRSKYHGYPYSFLFQ